MLRPVLFLVFGVGPALAIAGGPEDFDTAPESAAATLLPAALVAGPDFHVVDPVQGDGLMNRFVLESRFGTFGAYGRAALAVRVREVAALHELARTSDVAIAAGGAVQGVQSEVKTAAGVVTHPVETVTGIPRGIGHLFGGYRARGEEAVADARQDVNAARAGAAAGGSAGEGAAHAADRGAHAAQSYAARYLGITAAERDYYRRLGIDPYTDNQVLRDTIHRDARIRAAAGFGMKFVGLPGIPGIGLTQRAVDAIYNEDPAVIRRRTRATLAAYGLSAAEIAAFLDAPLLSPTRQMLLLENAESLAGVAGRGELFRHSIGLTSPEEVEVYLASVALLVKAHAGEPVAALVAGVRLPTALRADGRLVVCGAFESIYWTAGVADLEAQLEAALPAQPQPVARELWIAGTLSGRARAALESRGWQLRPQNLPP
ncbi:MAG: hypothetical protein KGJ68_05110 [Gammaproteobacteria bacterium]|nr:hypothetical protein [Gammaproteobacteria bacterium]